jgi:glycogen debranching enzyme
MDGDGAQGLFVRDVRILSRWRLRMDGYPVEPLGGFTAEPFAGVFLGRARVRDGRVEPTLLVERRRSVGDGMREDLVLHNYGIEPAGVSLTLELAADFVDLFAVKVGRSTDPEPVDVEVDAGEWRARTRSSTVEHEVRVRAPEAAVTSDGIAFRTVVPPAGVWKASLEVVAIVAGVALPAPALASSLADGAPFRRPEERSGDGPTVDADSMALAAAFARSRKDLAALRLADPEQPDDMVIAAGAPWFMALFGRDSLLTSSMTVALNPSLAIGTLRALARHQGRQVDALSEEQPGRILHELRFGVEPTRSFGRSERYYGSVDATPLFVMVLGQLARWGVEREIIDELLPAADRALDWVTTYGDRDGDGFVEYLRSTDRGLRNQGWKDSVDGINFADGTLAEPPIALVEVQAYVYGAYRARSGLAAERGDTDVARYWREKAVLLKRRLNEEFWLPDVGYFAVGLDAEKRPIDALASNMGHVLWAGAAEPDKAASVCRHLLGPELFTGFGIRTLASTMGAYNPASYHNGSVWPHDTALAVSGLVRYGFHRQAQEAATALIAASTFFAGRLPELFCGFDRAAFPGPVPYPTSCSPQAWASAAPVAVLMAMLGLEPDIPLGRVRLAPALPGDWGAVRITDIPIGANRLSVEVQAGGSYSVTGADRLHVEGG